MSNRLLYILILLSGFSALIYEITWTRHLSLVFGSNMLAVGTVTAVFMAGLALGSLLFGRRVDRHRSPLKLYAILEAGISLCGLLFPLLLGFLTDLYVSLSAQFPENAALIGLVRIALAGLLLLPPTICMGGTLPVVCRFLARENIERLVGRLYALNTFGAVAGCLAGGFLLIPQFGMFASQGIAIAINIAIALLAWKYATESEPDKALETSEPEKNEAIKARQRLLLFGAAFLGLSALGLEMLWTRFFLLFLGNTTYAFSTILGVFLFGLTGGSYLYARFLSKFDNRAAVYFWLIAAMALYLLATLPAYDRIGFLFESIHRSAENNWWQLAGFSFFAVALPVLIPAALSGALFPATVSLLQTDREHSGTTVGKVLFFNTIGAMGGSFTGVYAITVFGLQGSFRFLALLLVLYTGIILYSFRGALALRITTPALLLSAILLVIPLHWNQGLMNSGIYIYSHYYLNTGGLGGANTAQPDDLVEGIETTAAFFRSADGFKEFRVNGKSDGGTRPGDILTQTLLGQLPMLFRPDADPLLVIGLGTGITLAQVLDYPARQIDCAEISPEVAAIAGHFSEENGNVLASPRVDLHIRDGRNLLLTGEKTYDVIVSEPSNPWQTGNANLFTREFYQQSVMRLSKNGIFCQWLPLYDLPTDQLRIALKTFADSFPHVRVFVLGGDMIMLGSPSELSLDLPPLAPEIEKKVTGSLQAAGIPSVQQVIERYAFANEVFLKAASGQVPLNTDDLPHLEFTRQTGVNFTKINLQYLVEKRRNFIFAEEE